MTLLQERERERGRYLSHPSPNAADSKTPVDDLAKESYSFFLSRPHKRMITEREREKVGEERGEGVEATEHGGHLFSSSPFPSTQTGVL